MNRLARWSVLFRLVSLLVLLVLPFRTVSAQSKTVSVGGATKETLFRAILAQKRRFPAEETRRYPSLEISCGKRRFVYRTADGRRVATSPRKTAFGNLVSGWARVGTRVLDTRKCPVGQGADTIYHFVGGRWQEIVSSEGDSAANALSEIRAAGATESVIRGLHLHDEGQRVDEK